MFADPSVVIEVAAHATWLESITRKMLNIYLVYDFFLESIYGGRNIYAGTTQRDFGYACSPS